MAKYFIFLGILGDIDRVETGVSEEGINAMKTLPKLAIYATVANRRHNGNGF